jgi:Cu(I)/Ag(I) efflux system periplasmic protein CusF
MNSLKHSFLVFALATGSLAPIAAFSQMAMDHGKMSMSAANEMTEGEIKKISPESGKITIKHGEIKNLDMPGMTMVFAVADSKMLDKFKVGDKVRFTVEQQPGKLVVTRMDPAS